MTALAFVVTIVTAVIFISSQPLTRGNGQCTSAGLIKMGPTWCSAQSRVAEEAERRQRMVAADLASWAGAVTTGNKQ